MNSTKKGFISPEANKNVKIKTKSSKIKTFSLVLSILIAFSILPILTNAADPNATSSTDKTKEEISAQIVKTVYPTNDVVIADIVVSSPKYNVDPTGKTDSTAGIQKALDDCYKEGGGTVFLPVGKYRVTKTITTPAFVTLRGDWLDPDTVTTVKDYGTVILADVESTQDDLPALIILNSSGGAMGLTIYYPKQDINNVKPFPYTFYAFDGTHCSLINCTIINGYKGIAAGIKEKEKEIENDGHTNLKVENVKGTCLYRGAESYHSGDIDIWKQFTLDNKYWASAPTEYKPAERVKINAYTRKNGIGIILGDLDCPFFTGIYISDYKIGVQTTRGMRRTEGPFWGALYDMYIRRCGSALQLDYDAFAVISRGILEGEEYLILKNNDAGGVISFAGVELKGKVNERHNVWIEKLPLGEDFEIDYNRFPSKPPAVLYNVDNYGADKTGKKDTSASIQKALDDAAKAGGGIVYLPAGYYRLDKPLTVGKNVLLRGCATLPTSFDSIHSIGTIILAYYGESSNPDNAMALITLNGENAGASGLLFIYPENGSDRKLLSCKKYSYTIRGTSKGVYVNNSSMLNSYNGTDFRNCDNHIIKNVIGCYYNNGAYVGGKNGLIEGFLANEGINTLIGSELIDKIEEFKNWITWDDRTAYHNNLADLRNVITIKNTCLVKVDKADTQTILNTQAFCYKTLVSTTESTNTLMINLTLDSRGGTSLIFKGGDAKVVNMYDCGPTLDVPLHGSNALYTSSGTQLTMFNLFEYNIPKTILPYPRPPQNLKELSSRQLLNKYEILYGSEFTEDKGYFTSHKTTKNDKDIVLALKIPATDISALENESTYIEFRLYISDIKQFKELCFEITSSGECDKDEYQWSIDATNLKTGWNTVRYTLYDPSICITGKSNLKRINFIRWYMVECNAGLQLKFDDLRIVQYNEPADELVVQAN